MNRNQEYLELTKELEEMKAPGGSVLRAMARKKKERRSKLFLRPLAGVAAAFAAFVLTVNVSPTVAKACEGIPILGDLAEAVSFSPSLSKAVENDYYQKVIQQKAIEGVDGASISVDYMIVDQKSVNIFYHLSAPTTDKSEYLSPCVTKPDGSEFTDFSACYSRDHYDAEKNIRMEHCMINFDDQVPESLLLRIEWRRITGFAESEDENGNYIPTELSERIGEPVEFLLDLDEAMTNQGRHYDADQTLELDGQCVRITGVDVYPSYTSFSVECDPNNSAWLEGLEYYLLTPDGNHLGKANPITAEGDANSRNLGSIRAVSVFFDQPERVTLCVTGAQWTEKSAEIHVDLANKTAEGMPAGASIEQIERKDNGWEIRIKSTSGYDPIYWEYTDPEGKCCMIGDSTTEEVGPDENTYWIFTHVLKDYPWNEVRLAPRYTQVSEYDEPVTAEFELK